MLTTIFLGFAPIVCICAFVLLITSAILWHSFAKISNNGNYTEIGAKIILCVLVTTAVFTITLIPGLVVSNFHKAQIALVCLSFVGCYPVARPRAMGVDHITFLGFSIISSVSLLLSKNLINIFFTLELINMLVIYSFFLNAVSAKQVPMNSALKISASCTYQFILNFFSSIILFVAIN